MLAPNLNEAMNQFMNVCARSVQFERYKLFLRMAGGHLPYLNLGRMQSSDRRSLGGVATTPTNPTLVDGGKTSATNLVLVCALLLTGTHQSNEPVRSRWVAASAPPDLSWGTGRLGGDEALVLAAGPVVRGEV